MRRTSLRRAFCYVPLLAMLTLMSAYNGDLVRYHGMLCQRSEEEEVEQETVSAVDCEEKVGVLVFEVLEFFYAKYTNRSDWNRFCSLEEDGKLRKLVIAHVCNVMSCYAP